MEISSNFVGTPLKPYVRSIDWPEIMYFAASVDDNNPYYFDDEREEGIVAPPMFSIIANWPIIKNINEHIEQELEEFPMEVLSTIVHYTEYLKIYRLIKPGDKLTIAGKIIAILPHRAGTHIVVGLEVKDQDDQLVSEEYIGGMLRGVECKGEGKVIEDFTQIPIFETQSEPSWKEIIHIDTMKPYIYDACTDLSVVPIHTSRQFAHLVGLPDIILHGTATLALAIKIITNRELHGDPFHIREIACKFTGMVLPNTDIQLCLNGKTPSNDPEHYFFDIFNEEGRKTISQGYIKIGK
ncbi:MAG: MaoC family dehydratase N-terminal domain-containing protein [Candidatus Heimdallarchaeota archaeon]|nr:MAG: MaoC family dehydratase N-terminal domain-containing protein [Candidatus Heimdallarchaeota archaeon]